MKFVMPIKGKTARVLYSLNRDGHGGFYPIGLNNAYHGGMHFEGDHIPVVAIADGTIIAYRYCKKHLEETSGGQTYKYSNCFILIKHEYTTPKGQKLTFYSHYNHLFPWDELKEWAHEDLDKLPKLVTKPGFTIKQDSLSLRSSPKAVNGAHSNQIGSLSSGQSVIASPVSHHPGWAKKEGANEYFCYEHNRHKYAIPSNIATDPELDKVVSSCNIPIKAGDIIGYTGSYESENLPRGLIITHVEVFAGNDVEDFVKNRKTDGRLTVIKIAAPKRELYRRDMKYPDLSHITSVIRPPDTKIEVFRDSKKQSNHHWVKVKDKRYAASVPHAWLHYSHGQYTAKAAHLAQINTVFNKFDGITITPDTKFFLEGNEPHDHRLISLDVPTPQEYWIQDVYVKKRHSHDFIEDTIHGYINNPDKAIYTSMGPIPYDYTTISMGTVYDDDVLWHQVEAAGMQGWVKDSDITKCTPYDWLCCGFSLIKEEDESTPRWKDEKAEDSRIDIEKSPEPFKSIFNSIDISKDGKIDEHELISGIRSEATAYKLSRLICRHQTEWYYDDNVQLYKDVIENTKNHFGQQRADNLKARIKQLCWWNEVSDLPSKTVWHINPVAFVEQMLFINGFALTLELLKQIDPRAKSSDINKHLDGLNEAIIDWEMSSCIRVAHFIAQVLSESMHLSATSEMHATDEHYGGYKGRGLMQLTFHEAYVQYGEFVGEDFTGTLANKQKVEHPPHAARSAGWVWGAFKKLNGPADKNDLIYISYLINGGFNGFDARLDHAKNALKVLCQDQVIDTNYSITNSMAAQDLKACFSWGIWHDPDTAAKPGCTKNASKATEGYQQFIKLHDSLGKPILSANMYGYNKNHIRHFVEERVTALTR